MIKIVNVSKSYGSETLFKEVSFSLSPGDFCCIIGASGTGKTTLLHLIMGVDNPNEGHVDIDGRVVGSLKHSEREHLWGNVLGIVFQDALLIPEFLVWENIALKGFVAGMSRNEAYERAEGLGSYLGIKPLLNRMVSGLSGGEQQRVALARALFMSPRYLLADEPTSALDDQATMQFMQLLDKARFDYNLGVCLVSHDPRVHGVAPHLFCLQNRRLLKHR
ncbi:TPA: hypothetical protein DCW54_01205 [Candidatus Dependentiae bacterium]|nr:hypothetical protein [Candidatus Dependentiae bacterium]